MDVSPLRALAIVLVFLLIGGLAVFSSMEAARIQGPSELRRDKSGDLHVRVHHKVFVYDELASYIRSYDLRDMGIDELWGGLAFFGNGDLLLSPSLLGNSAPDESGSGYAALDQLNRCDRESFRCRPLTGFDRKFSSSYRALIDDQDRLYLSETGSGRVFLLDSDGQLLDELAEQLSRPNELMLHNGQLVIADTEAESLLLVPMAQAGFSPSETWRRIATGPVADVNRSISQPVDLERADQGWVALVKNRNMDRAALRFYDEAGDYLREVALPGTGFVIALASLAGDLVVSDYRNMRILRFDALGEQIDDLTSPPQKKYIEEIQSRKQLFDNAGIGGWLLFAVLAVAGIVIGVRGELQRPRQEEVESPGVPAEALETPRPLPSESSIRWLGRPRVDILAILIALMLFVGLSLVFLVPAPAEVSGCSLEMLVVYMALIALAIVVLPLIVLRRRLARFRIGVRDEWVLVRFPNGDVESSRDVDLIKFHNGFIIGDRKVLVGDERRALYKKEDVAALLRPRLDNARAMGHTEHLKWDWEHRRTTLVSVGLLIVLGLVLALLLETEVADEWMKKELAPLLETQCPPQAEEMAPAKAST